MLEDLQQTKKKISKGKTFKHKRCNIQVSTDGLNAMPNHASLLSKCRKNYAAHAGGGHSDFHAFANTIPDMKTPLPKSKTHVLL